MAPPGAGWGALSVHRQLKRRSMILRGASTARVATVSAPKARTSERRWRESAHGGRANVPEKDHASRESCSVKTMPALKDNASRTAPGKVKKQCGGR